MAIRQAVSEHAGLQQYDIPNIKHGDNTVNQAEQLKVMIRQAIDGGNKRILVGEEWYRSAEQLLTQADSRLKALKVQVNIDPTITGNKFKVDL